MNFKEKHGTPTQAGITIRHDNPKEWEIVQEVQP